MLTYRMGSALRALVVGVCVLCGTGCATTIKVASEAELDAIEASSRQRAAYVKLKEQYRAQKATGIRADEEVMRWTNRKGKRQQAELTEISRVQFRNHGEGMIQGLGLGMALGVAAGVAVGAGAEVSWPYTRGQAIAQLAAIFGGLGGVGGAVLGMAGGSQLNYEFTGEPLQDPYAEEGDLIHAPAS